VWDGWNIYHATFNFGGLVGSLVEAVESWGLLIAALFSLLKLRWVGRGGIAVSRDMFPTLEPALIGNGRFTASGWRNDAENYLFLNRADAEDFKEAINQQPVFNRLRGEAFFFQMPLIGVKNVARDLIYKADASLLPELV
jgi:hypothetical protein